MARRFHDVRLLPCSCTAQPETQQGAYRADDPRHRPGHRRQHDHDHRAACDVGRSAARPQRAVVCAAARRPPARAQQEHQGQCTQRQPDLAGCDEPSTRPSRGSAGRDGLGFGSDPSPAGFAATVLPVRTLRHGRLLSDVRRTVPCRRWLDRAGGRATRAGDRAQRRSQSQVVRRHAQHRPHGAAEEHRLPRDRRAGRLVPAADLLYPGQRPRLRQDRRVFPAAADGAGSAVQFRRQFHVLGQRRRCPYQRPLQLVAVLGSAGQPGQGTRLSGFPRRLLARSAGAWPLSAPPWTLSSTA